MLISGYSYPQIVSRLLYIQTYLYPNIGARIAVGHVDVKQIGLRGPSEALEQFSRSMAGAKRLGTGHGDAGDVIQAGHFVTRKPQPGRGAIAGCTVIHGVLQPAAHCGGYLRLQTRRGTRVAGDTALSTEFSPTALQ